MNNSRIIVALDYPDPNKVLDLLDRLDAKSCRIKIGKELFCRTGSAFVKRLVGRGFDVFLDLKFHDIPNTVAQACKAAADLGVWMINVHAMGGHKMMEAARGALDTYTRPPLLIAVTILTSLNEHDMHEIGLPGTITQNVLCLASLAKHAGMDGVVCSPQEAAMLRKTQGDKFCLVTPGVRPQGLAQNDQERIMTPSEALQNGADYLVIGRPITQANEPQRALLAISAEIESLSL